MRPVVRGPLIRHTLPIAFFLLATAIGRGTSELYTSVEEISKWSQTSREVWRVLGGLIESQEGKLRKLKRIQQSIGPLPKSNRLASTDGCAEPDASDRAEYCNDPNPPDFQEDERQVMSNPVNAFVTISRLQRALDEVDNLICSADGDGAAEDHVEQRATTEQSWLRTLRETRDELPIEDDLAGSAKALLRLQVFYDLKLGHLVKGTLAGEEGVASNNREALQNDSDSAIRPRFKPSHFQMNAWDCFELGKIAFRDDQFALAIQWLFKALELIHGERSSCADAEEAEEFELVINQILDHMAFAAYKLDMVEYSANLTRTWLEREPENERARENLDYYLEVLAGDNEERAPQDEEEEEEGEGPGEEGAESVDELLYPKLRNGIDQYSSADDHTVRELCRRQVPDLGGSSGQQVCQVSRSPLTRDGRLFEPGVRVEILSEEPRVVRLHEIITPKEAEHLRRAALPLLERSTVNSGAGLKTSDFRIAKTAWLPSASDELVARLEQRLGSILQVNMEGAEHLQVVNYGLGGFYGPHLDSARSFLEQHAGAPQTNEGARQAPVAGPDESEAPVATLRHNDRLATVLIYLNQVAAGGATVFPKLNLTVEPVERSAVVWFNIHPRGHSDERTLHTGCPVLLGSKWIATKWPRERSNRLLARCRLADGPPVKVDRATGRRIK